MSLLAIVLTGSLRRLSVTSTGVTAVCCLILCMLSIVVPDIFQVTAFPATRPRISASLEALRVRVVKKPGGDHGDDGDNDDDDDDDSLDDVDLKLEVRYVYVCWGWGVGGVIPILPLAYHACRRSCNTTLFPPWMGYSAAKRSVGTAAAAVVPERVTSPILFGRSIGVAIFLEYSRRETETEG